MIIKFIGDQNPDTEDDTQLIVAFGIDFPLNEWVEVTDAHICAKLSGNPHFEVAESSHKVPAEPEPEPEPIASPQDIDSELIMSCEDKEELEIIGRELGIELDRRKGVAKLQAELIQALDHAD